MDINLLNKESLKAWNGPLISQIFASILLTFQYYNYIINLEIKNILKPYTTNKKIIQKLLKFCNHKVILNLNFNKHY